MADQWKVIYDVSNGTIFNDLDQPLIQFSRSQYSLTPKICCDFFLLLNVDGDAVCCC